jgi:hypothetical protein
MPLASPHDRYIMSPEGISSYTKSQQQDLNWVRIYLQATTLADLADPTSTNQITSWALNGTRSPEFEGKAFWPRQEEPSSKQKKLWRRFMSSQFLRYGKKYWKQTPCAPQCEASVATANQPSSPSAPSIHSIIKRLPKGKRRLLSHFRQLVSEQQMWTECRSKYAMTIASDGGLKDKSGTFGWQIRSASDEILVEGAGPIDGPFDVANSTRCL